MGVSFFERISIRIFIKINRLAVFYKYCVIRGLFREAVANLNFSQICFEIFIYNIKYVYKTVNLFLPILDLREDRGSASGETASSRGGSPFLNHRIFPLLCHVQN